MLLRVERTGSYLKMTSLITMELIMTTPKKRIVRFPYLQRATGMSRAACYREIERNPNFPKRIKLGERCVGFDADEVDTYVLRVIAKRSIFDLSQDTD